MERRNYQVDFCESGAGGFENDVDHKGPVPDTRVIDKTLSIGFLDNELRKQLVQR